QAKKDEDKALEELRTVGDDPKNAAKKRAAERRRDENHKKAQEAAKRLADLGQPVEPANNDAPKAAEAKKDGPLLADSAVRSRARQDLPLPPLGHPAQPRLRPRRRPCAGHGRAGQEPDPPQRRR